VKQKPSVSDVSRSMLQRPSLSEVVAGLNALGVAPRDMIDILKSIKASGVLHAEFIVR
jgi:flagellar basal body P-ring protein FlgI